MDYFIKLDNIDLDTTFNCGQCFRWHETADGVYSNGEIQVRQAKNGIILHNVEKSDIPYWENYFCADEDYGVFIERFSQDSTLREACAFAPGIRVLRQDAFETLISFIISQNNNIKRITGIINKICHNGSFPVPCELLSMDLTAIGAGYRARYILDAAKKVNSGEINLDEIAKMPYNEAKARLLKIIGVGDKVADCVLLFGFHQTRAFPKDVWIKRAIAKYYPDGLPGFITGYEGIAQQFLFHYIKNKKD
jgi:N-glycosylase/DNA lyase